MKKEILAIENLNKIYKNNGIVQHVVKDINISFSKNQIIGLLGRNGAGKTTFIKSCIDLIKYEGSILYSGKSLKEMTRTEKVNSFSAVLEGSRNIYLKLTAIEKIKYFSSLRGVKFSKIKELVDYLLNYLFLYEKRNHLVENLSSGMKQKVALICAFAMNTPIVFLDEPTLGLDLESKNHVVNFLNNSEFCYGKLIIVTSHDLNLINRVSSNILLLKDGQLNQYNIIENNNNTFDFTMLKNSKLINLITSLNSNELYSNDKFATYRIVCGNVDLSGTISLLEKNLIEIMSIKNKKYNLEDFYLS
ncbi:MAG: ABC transporter ATP-binding protein [Bacteroidales bacterium]|jgi:ABC-2 type transport system ATP-binding protein|nr:ABC transporter ATP-binding protein [Bacteroidales bacterium]